MTAPANAVATHEGCTLWDDEVRKLFVALPDLSPAAKAAVRSVLVALAADESLDAAGRADVRRLLTGPRSPGRTTGSSRRSPFRAMTRVHSGARVHSVV